MNPLSIASQELRLSLLRLPNSECLTIPSDFDPFLKTGLSRNTLQVGLRSFLRNAWDIRVSRAEGRAFFGEKVSHFPGFSLDVQFIFRVVKNRRR